MRNHWREWIGRASLPMLALPASWGVYQFQLIFVGADTYIAVLSALAFELVYIGMAVSPTRQTRRAMAISVAAVVVSAVYNTLAAAFHLAPALLADVNLAGVALLALLHGAPLAVLAYAVASHLLHAPSHDDSVALATMLSTPVAAPVAAQQVTVNVLATESAAASDAPASKTARVRLLASRAGVTESTMWRRVRARPELLEEV